VVAKIVPKTRYRSVKRPECAKIAASQRGICEIGGNVCGAGEIFSKLAEKLSGSAKMSSKLAEMLSGSAKMFSKLAEVFF
jgi:hypothetical protein